MSALPQKYDVLKPSCSQDSSRHEKDHQRNNATRPFWLSKAALIGFALVFLACALSLITVNQLINSRDGLSLTVSSSEYSWTYGPTAILVVILSLWRRVDYFYKSTQPWREVQAGPTPSQKSLLLDYVTPFQLFSLTKAFRLRHYAVAATITSFFLLKLIILISTTLFTVGTSPNTGSSTVEYQDAFNSSNIWTSPGYQNTTDDDYDPGYAGGSDASLLAYVATLNNVTSYDLDWRPQSDLAMQQFSLSKASASNVTAVHAPVDVFVPAISCEEANITLLAQQDGWYVEHVSIRSATCTIKNVAMEADVGISGFAARGYDSKRTEKISRRVYCSEAPHHARYAWLVVQFEETDDDDTEEALQASSGVICDIGYHVASTPVTHDLLTNGVTWADGALDNSTRRLHNLTNHDLAEMILGDFRSTDSASLSIYSLMEKKLEALGKKGTFLTPGLLKTGLVPVLEGVATELAKLSLLINSSTTGPCEVSLSERRLFTRPTALWTMVASFFLLAVLCLLLLLVPTNAWIPVMKGSMAAHAILLAKSPSVQTLLRDTGHYRGSELKRLLENRQFMLAEAEGAVTLEVVERKIADSTDASPTGQTEEAPRKKKPWVPLAAQRWLIVLTLLLPMVVIGVLQLLYQLSAARNGLVSMDSTDSSTSSYMVRLASTLVVFAVATMFNTLDSGITESAPYSNLRSGNAPAGRSVLLHLLSVSPFLVLPYSLRRRQWGVAISNLCTLVGSTLTIIVSGLWTPVTHASVQSSTGWVDNWDQSWLSQAKGNDSDGGAATMWQSVLHDVVNSQSGIWNGIVLPNISPSTSTDNRTTTHVYHALGLRPVLNCTVVPQDEIFRKDSGGFMYVTVNATVPAECSDDASDGTGVLTIDLDMVSLSSSSYIGEYHDLDGTTAGQVTTACPSVGIVAGFSPGTNGTKADLTALLCSQSIQEVPVKVTYLDEELSSHQLPTLGSGAARTWRNESSGAPTMGYQLAYMMTNTMAFFSLNSGPDGIFNAVFDILFNNYGYAPADFVGTENVTTLIEAVERMHEEYMVQVINLNFRAQSNSTRSELVSAAVNSSAFANTPTTEIPGTSSHSTSRLAIHHTSALVLQVELAVMVVLGLASYAFVRMRGTLPRDSGTAASSMSFLAGSRLCDPASGILPRDAEGMSERELDRALRPYRFGLGWWRQVRQNEAAGSMRASMYETVTLVSRDRSVSPMSREESASLARSGVSVSPPRDRSASPAARYGSDESTMAARPRRDGLARTTSMSGDESGEYWFGVGLGMPSVPGYKMPDREKLDQHERENDAMMA